MASPIETADASVHYEAYGVYGMKKTVTYFFLTAAS
jgi:hypothetical protein